MKKQEELFEFIARRVPRSRLEHADRADLIKFIELQEELTLQLQKQNDQLRALHAELAQQSMMINEQLVVIKNKLYGKSSEKRASDSVDEDLRSIAKRKRVLLPSERYPDAPLIERKVEFSQMPSCRCCGAEMKDSGLSEDSEFLTVIPAQYLVIRQMRQKVRCEKCHGDMQTAPAPERIKEGTSYSDEMVIDVALTKYCDLIPVERYAEMAGREGLEGLPPHSLIEQTHNLADFVEPVYEKLKEEVMAEKVIHADETPHRMLEGDKKSNWYLWGFSTMWACFFECHNSRSGDVASEVLKNSKCEFLVSDVYSGYGRAVRIANEVRVSLGLPAIENIYCNAHARRKFVESEEFFKDESDFFIKNYQEIYRLESEVKDKPPDEVFIIRAGMLPKFQAMKSWAEENMNAYSSKSSLVKAMSYFLGNYNALTRFLQIPDLPIDNNSQERLLRNPVVGRKTWYGTHSKRGAKTAAILFSLVESCKLNNVNPRKYFAALVKDLHAKNQPQTPSAFAKTKSN